jgi:hypothetical protein
LNPINEAELEEEARSDPESILQEIILEHLGLEQQEEEEDNTPEWPVYSI